MARNKKPKNDTKSGARASSSAPARSSETGKYPANSNRSSSRLGKLLALILIVLLPLAVGLRYLSSKWLSAAIEAEQRAMQSSQNNSLSALSASELEALLELPHVNSETNQVIDIEHWTNIVDQALAEIERLYPNDGQVQHLMGLVHLRLKRTKLAEPHLYQAVKLLPNLHEARSDLAELLVQLGRDSEAVQVLNDRPGLAEATWQFFLQLGECHQRLGKLDEAFNAFSIAQQRAQSSSAATETVWAVLWLKLASIKHQQRRFDEALEFAEKSRQLADDNPELWLLMSQILKALKKTEPMQAAQKRWSELSILKQKSNIGRDFEVEHSKSMSQLLAGIFRSIAAVYLEKSSTNADSIHTSNLDRAESLYQQALQLEVTDPHALAGLAGIERRKGNYLQAMDYNRRLIQLEPAQIAHYQNLANLAMELNQPAIAEATLRLACCRNPSDRKSQEVLNQFLDFLGQTTSIP